jgi:hypothetical protein
MYDKTELKNKLSNNVVSVIFEKTDGTERHMTCTLMEKYIPEKNTSTRHVPRQDNDNVLAVWDIENNGWRSFRIDSLRKIENVV